jgi:hypothetical protein
MTRFRDEVKLIPGVAWAIAVLCYLLMALLFVRVVFPDPDFAGQPGIVKLLFGVLVPLPLVLFVLLVGYVYADAKRRAMRHVLWTWVAALVPNGIGIILYFVMRTPIAPRPCPQCGTTARAGFAFCANCGAALSPACPGCRRAAEPGWSHCPYCGTKLS